MRSSSLPVFVLLAIGMSLLGQPPKPQPKTAATASGVFVGRSGKPMVKARLLLAEVAGDQQVTYARLKLVESVDAVADQQGQFQLKGFAPGTYAIVYQKAGDTPVIPVAISIRALLAVTKSVMPLLRGIEVGSEERYPDRVWGRQFTLLRGHTFLTEGASMKIWNATARYGPTGPYLEIRRGTTWLHRLEDKSQIKFDAWSF